MGHAQAVVLNEVARPERRRYPRYQCEFPVEIRLTGGTFGTQGQTTDVSLGGCYVSSAFNMAVGTEIELKLWVGDVAVRTNAIIRTSDPGVGNGIEFAGLNTEGQQALSDYFAKLDSCPAEKPEGSLHGLLIV